MNDPQQQTHNMRASMSSPALSPPVDSTISKRIVYIVVGVVAIVLLGLRFANFELPSENDDYISNEPDSKQEVLPEPEIKQITVGSIVVIKEGAVYGGLSSARGRSVPISQLEPTTHTVTRIETHHGVEEALLKEIYSWVALHSLQLVTDGT